MPSMPSGMPVSELPMDFMGKWFLRTASMALRVEVLPTEPAIPIITGLCFLRAFLAVIRRYAKVALFRRFTMYLIISAERYFS